MKNTDIAKIRQLLKQAENLTSNVSGKDLDPDIYCLIGQALALLPCSTCNGTEIKKPESGCGECLAGDGNCRADCPCPDCES